MAGEGLESFARSGKPGARPRALVQTPGVVKVHHHEARLAVSGDPNRGQGCGMR